MRRFMDLKSWKGGVYVVKEAYKLIQAQASEPVEFQGDRTVKFFFWKTLAHYEATAFIWRLLHNRLPTNDNINKRCKLDDEELKCILCKEQVETADHLLSLCKAMFSLGWQDPNSGSAPSPSRPPSGFAQSLPHPILHFYPSTLLFIISISISLSYQSLQPPFPPSSLLSPLSPPALEM